MDDRFDKESIDTETRYPRREAVDGHTRYPVREERRPLRFSSEHHTEVPERKTAAENDMTAYEQRTAARRAEFLQNSYENSFEKSYEREETAHRRGQQRGQTEVPRRDEYRTEMPRRESSRKESSHSRERAYHEEPTRYTRDSRTAGKGHPQKNGGRKKHHKKRHLTRFSKGLILILVALIIGIGSFIFMNHLMNPPTEEMNLTGETVSVTIPEGAGTDEIAKILKENKLISSVFGFKLTSRLEGYDGTYKQGKYDIDTGLTKRQIMELLQSGKTSEDLKVTIPEGYTVKQIAAKVAEMELCTADEFIEECNKGTFDYAFLKDLPDREYKLEGYLFPDTYLLHEGMTAHDIIDMMLARFDQMYTKEYQQAVADSGYTLDEIVTVASMIEKEIKVESERATAAGVIYNRLKEDMSLGIDATVLYAVGKTSGELTTAELETDSPYNTRKNKGLPLGPISNPGESSFKAALYPEDNEYLYYVVEAVGKDNHVFCKTYDEFLAAKDAYNASAQ